MSSVSLSDSFTFTLPAKKDNMQHNPQYKRVTQGGLLNIITDDEMIVSFRRLNESSFSTEEKEELF